MKKRLTEIKTQLLNQAQGLLELSEEIVILIDEMKPETPFSVERTGPRKVLVSWTGELDDIEYYRPGEEEWRHSVKDYGHSVEGLNEFPIEFQEPFQVAFFRGIRGNEGTEIVKIGEMEDDEEPVPEPEPDPEPKPKPKPKPEPEPQRLPSTNPADWKYHGIVISGRQMTGRDYTVGGVFERDGKVGLLYQSKQNIPGKALTATSVAFSENINLFDWKEPEGNPVLADAMSWQGVNDRGQAHRVGTRAMVDNNGTLIAYYRDRVGRYPGMRAAGVATSTDGVEWNQLDRPFMTVEDAYRIIPKKYFSGSPVFTHGRIYINHAAVAGEYVYLLVNVSTGGEIGGGDQDFIIRGKDPMNIDSFEFVPTAWLDGTGGLFRTFYKIGNSWICIQNINNRDSSGKVHRYLGVQKMNSLQDRFSPKTLIDSKLESSTDGRALIHFQRKYHLIYSDNRGGIHLLSEK